MTMVGIPTVGRTADFLWGDTSPPTVVAGVQEKSVNCNGEAVDVTSDENGGWRTLLTVPAENQVDISVSGIMKSHRLEADWHAGTRTRTASFVYDDGAQISGTFYLNQFNITGSYNGAITFEATLMSSGVITYTPAS